MNNKELENKIKQAFSHSVPNVLDAVIENRSNSKGKVIVMTQEKKKRTWIGYVSGIAAALVVLVVGIMGFNIYNNEYKVDSTVSLDVNPSIQIKVNQNERVLEVNPLNDDAEKVVEGMDFKGSDLDVAVNALIGSMLRNGYITELSNSILVTVNNDDMEKGIALQEKLAQEINALLQTDTFSGAVLSQTVVENTELKNLSDTYGITIGKAQLIQQIVNQNPLYTFEKLVPLSINELNLLSSSSNTTLENVDSIGSASDKNYIGVQKAQEAALSHAGISADDAVALHTEMDYEDGIMIYEVEFYYDVYEYDYEIDAKSGAVLKSEKDFDDDAVRPENGNNGTSTDIPSNNNTSADNGNSGNSTNTGSGTSSGSTVSGNSSVNASYISAEKAKQTALSHAGVSESDIREYDIEMDREDGIVVYEIDFKSGNFEFDYEINAETGSIIKYEKEFDD